MKSPIPFKKSALAAAMGLSMVAPLPAMAIAVCTDTPSLVVNSLQEGSCSDGKTSLPEAIAYANNKAGADTITFASGLSGNVDFVRESVYDDLHIQGPGIDIITLDGGALHVRNDSESGVAKPVSLTVSEASLSTYERSFIEVSSLGGVVTLDNVKVEGEDFASLIDVDISFESETDTAAKQTVIIKDSVVSDSSFYEAIASTSINDEAGFSDLGIDIIIENSHFDNIEAPVGFIAQANEHPVSIKLKNSSITASEFSNGGAIVAESSDGDASVVIEDSLLDNLDSYGGVVIADSYEGEANLTVESTKITSNTGGLIAKSEDGVANLTLKNTEVTGNTFESDGLNADSNYGAASLTLKDTEITDNSFGGDGLTAETEEGDLNVSIVDSNISNNEGKAINLNPGKYASNVDMMLESTTVSGNSDGGIELSGYFDNDGLDSFSVAINNCTISGNNGGGIEIDMDTNSGVDVALDTSITNSTIVGNSGSNGYGGGIYVDGVSDEVIIKNSIVANNLNAGGYDSNIYGEFVVSDSLFASIENSSHYSRINGLSPADIIYDDEVSLAPADNIILGEDPELQDLSRRGGALVHALKSTSPAIGAGDAAAENLPEKDQQGQARLRNGQLDLGAVQYLAQGKLKDDFAVIPDSVVSYTFDVLANDTPSSDSEFDFATLAIVAQPKHGQLTVNTNDGKITYEPGASFKGLDGFRYSISEKSGTYLGEASVLIGDQKNEDTVETVEEAVKRKKKDGSGSSSGLLLLALGFLGLRRFRK